MQHMVVGAKSPAIGGVMFTFSVLDANGVAVDIVNDKNPVDAQTIQQNITNDNIPTGEVVFDGQTISSN